MINAGLNDKNTIFWFWEFNCVCWDMAQIKSFLASDQIAGNGNIYQVKTCLITISIVILP